MGGRLTAQMNSFNLTRPTLPIGVANQIKANTTLLTKALPALLATSSHGLTLPMFISRIPSQQCTKFFRNFHRCSGFRPFIKHASEKTEPSIAFRKPKVFPHPTSCEAFMVAPIIPIFFNRNLASGDTDFGKPLGQNSTSAGASPPISGSGANFSSTPAAPASRPH